MTREAAAPGAAGAAGAGAYRERLASRQGRVAELDRRHLRFSQMRLALFAFAVALATGLGRASGLWLVLTGVAFVMIAFRHARVLNARDRAARAVAFYERGVARVEDRWAGTGETGDRFRSDDHLFADDLDLFGRGEPVRAALHASHQWRRSHAGRLVDDPGAPR